MARNGMLNWWLLAFVFWAAFLLVLEPGNLSKAAALGHDLTIGREAARILCASLIGTAAMPAVLFLERRYPTSGQRLRDAAWLVLGLLALAGSMNLFSSVVAAWGFEGRWLPSASAVRRQLVGNWTLLAFALLGLVAIVRVVRAAASRTAPADASLREVIVRTGTRSERVALHDVDWIEAQGNYVALHVGPRTHLLRQTLTVFVTRLDPRFVRIHRSTVVALDRIAQLRSESDGEATVHLVTGEVLRVSRTHRRAVRERWTGIPAAAADPPASPGAGPRPTRRSAGDPRSSPSR